MLVFTVYFCLLLREITCVNIVSSEKDDIRVERTDKHTSNTGLDNRRLIQDLEDAEWHVAHLKDTEFARRSECVGDTYLDKVNRYRKALKNDGARVEFVSADAIQVNITDLINKDTSCKSPSNYTIFLKNFKPKSKNKQNSETKPGNEVNNNTDEREKHDTATTANVKKTLGENDKVQNKTESRRASEYQFSSVEYYDEVTEFDENMCPDAIEVITLEIDQLRSYDVECELMLEWRSLE